MEQGHKNSLSLAEPGCDAAAKYRDSVEEGEGEGLANEMLGVEWVATPRLN
jgi:hypothetical protein